MSERWKYQLRIGLFWGVFMSIFSILFELQEKPFLEQVSQNKFYFKLLINVIVGIFLFGYLNWKGQDDKNNSWSTFFKKNKKP